MLLASDSIELSAASPQVPSFRPGGRVRPIQHRLLGFFQFAGMSRSFGEVGCVVFRRLRGTRLRQKQEVASEYDHAYRQERYDRDETVADR